VHSVIVPAVPEQDLHRFKQLVPVGATDHKLHPSMVEAVHYRQPE